MSSGVLHRSLHAPTAVNAACCIETRDGHIVLLLQDTHLTCWKVGSDGLQQTASWRAPASMLQMVYLPSNHLLLLSEGGHCYLHHWQDECADLGAAAPPCVSHAQLQAPVGSSCSQVQPYGCVISSNVLSASAQQETPSLAAVAYMPGVLHVIKASPSKPHGESPGATASRTAAAVGSHMQLQTKPMALSHALLSCHYPGGDLPALASVRVHTRVLALTWLNPAEQQLDLEGRSLLAVLHEYAVGGNPPVLHVDCVAVNWLEGSISPGPWSIRNVHPTTRLLQPFPGSAQLPTGVLMISSRGVQLCTCLGSALQQQQHQQQAGWQQEQATSSSAAMQAAAAADPSAAVGGLCVVQHQLVQWALSGLPCSCVALSPGQWLVGDAQAGLTVLQLPESSSAAASWFEAQSRGCLSIPHVLLHVPLKQQQQESDMMVEHLQGEVAEEDLENVSQALLVAYPDLAQQLLQMQSQPQRQTLQQQQQQQQQHEEQQLAGLLVLGSKCSSSQVVGLPHVVAACGQQGDIQQQQLVLPVLQSALLPSLAGAQAAAVYTDPSGALPEQQLLVACGMAPRGKLAVVRSGCGLLPVMLDGPELPGDAALFAIKQPQRCQHKQLGPASAPCQQEQEQQGQQQPEWCADQHSMLGFSFPSVGASSVMSLEGNTFRQLQLEGFSQQEASLLIATAPGGWLVQVTAGGVRVLDPTANWQLHSQWVPTGGTISLAAACGSHLVVACGSSLTCFSISCCQGTLEVTATTDLQQQASALGMFTLQGGQLVVAVGLWVDNSIIMFSLTAHTAERVSHTQPSQQQQQQGVQHLHVLCCVALDADQPRSVALLPVGGADVLLVGSNTGKVLMWQVATNPRTSHQQQQQQQQTSCGSVGQGVVLQHARSVQVSNVSVSLQSTWLPAADEDPSHTFSSTANAAGPLGSRSAAAVPCVIAHAGAMAFFKPNHALLAAVQAQSGANTPDTGKTQQAAAAAAQPAHAAAAMNHHAFAHLGATAFVAVSRLCGSEGCLGAAPVHTPHMPFSLAWVSTSHRLCFGSISGQHRLRWRSCGLPGTPLALAVHETSDTLVLLLAADAFAEASSQQQQDYAQQRLVVLDARSLQVLMAVALAPGHAYTSLQVLELPATSQQQQQRVQCPSWGHGSSGGGAALQAAAGQKHQQQQERQPVGGRSNSPDGCLPFIVLGSHAVLAAPDSNSPASSSAEGGAAQPCIKRVGMLSFFELKKSVAPQQQQQQLGASSSGGSAALRYELVLHGMVPLSVTPSSTCAVVPELLSTHHQQQQQQLPAGADVSQTAGPTSPAGTAAAGASPGAAAGPAGGSELPLLAVGSEKGVTLLRVVVDDARLAEQQHLEQLLADAAQVPPDSLGLPAPAQQQQQQQQQAVGKGAPEVVHGASQALRRSHVSVQELSTVSVCFRGVVTKLSSSGSSIFALESLGPVTVLRAMTAQPGGWVQPVPVAVDARSRLMAVDFCVDPASRASLPAAAACLTAEAGATASPAAGTGALQQGRTGGAGTSSEVGRAGPAAGQQQPADLQQQQHQAILVATHPAGLMLLQRDLQQEASDLSAMLDAAQTAWERGQRPHGHMTAGRSVLLTEMTAAALGQPWQGAGEAAPWAAGHPLQHIQQQMMAEVEAAGAGAAEIAAAAREVLVAYARLSGSAAGQEGLVQPDWLSLLSVSPGLAAPMLPSAECGPAPGSMLMCQAQLGLHPAPVAGRAHTVLETSSNIIASSSGGGGGGRGGGPDDEQGLLSQGFVPGSCIVCLSASGCVSAAQLLPPAQAAALLAWQKAASFDAQGVSASLQLLNWGQCRVAAATTPADTTSSSNMDAAAVAQTLLRGLPCPDAAASYENYDQAPGALPAGTDRLQQAVQGAQAEHQGHREEVEPVGAVEGDLLMGVGPGAADAAGGQPAVILQHMLWQHAL